MCHLYSQQVLSGLDGSDTKILGGDSLNTGKTLVFQHQTIYVTSSKLLSDAYKWKKKVSILINYNKFFESNCLQKRPNQ